MKKVRYMYYIYMMWPCVFSAPVGLSELLWSRTGWHSSSVDRSFRPSINNLHFYLSWNCVNLNSRVYLQQLFFFQLLFLSTFQAPGMQFGASSFFPVCLWLCGKKNFNLCQNFWTIRDRDFIFGMYTQLKKPLQMKPRSMTLWPWPWPLY